VLAVLPRQKAITAVDQSDHKAETEICLWSSPLPAGQIVQTVAEVDNNQMDQLCF